jgi:ubiquinone/menaquinone biosynthesis C-methylase UbiE
MGEKPLMIQAKAPTRLIRRVYDLWSLFYGWIVEPLERRPRMIGLQRAGIQSHDRVLEVAVGTGTAFVEILRKLDKANVAYGVDLSPRMLAKTRRRASRAGYTNVDLREADARALPFPDASFDVLYNAYMLDLVPSDEIPGVLAEFKRVLKPGGRLMIVSMSKRAGDRLTLWERIYLRLPARWGAYITGGCRPVLLEGLVRQAGFRRVERTFLPQLLPSEIVLAYKPE